MPIFKIAADAGQGPASHEEFDFPDEAAARHDAQIALIEMAKDRIPLDGNSHFGVEIHDEGGRPLYKAALDFTADASGTTPLPETPDKADE